MYWRTGQVEDSLERAFSAAPPPHPPPIEGEGDVPSAAAPPPLPSPVKREGECLVRVVAVQVDDRVRLAGGVVEGELAARAKTDHGVVGPRVAGHEVHVRGPRIADAGRIDRGEVGWSGA